MTIYDKISLNILRNIGKIITSRFSKGLCQMAKQIIDQIRAAETDAMHTVEIAQISASEILKSARSEAQNIKFTSVQNATAEAKKMIATAENEAYKIKSRVSEENEREASVEFEKFDAKLDTAADFIISKILG